jgi:hypothetical protein
VIAVQRDASVVEHPERVKAVRRGDLAARMVRAAGELACLVRDESREAIGEWIGERTDEERDALLVVLAAMVDVSRPAADLLAWVEWDEFGHPLEAPRQRAPRGSAQCPSYAAWRRHKRHGEPAEECGCEKAKNEWRAKYQREQRKAAREARAA